MNMFKHLPAGIHVDRGDVSTEHRQARLDALPPPRSRADVLARLQDMHDAQYPVYRNITLATVLLDGQTGILEIWAHHPIPRPPGPHRGESPPQLPPTFRWNITDFFV